MAFANFMADPERENVIDELDLMNGDWVAFCAKCMRPHMYEYCDGRKETKYMTCNYHIRHPERITESELDVDKYGEIREDLGIRHVAMKLYSLNPERFYREYPEGAFPDAIDEATQKMLKPTRLHVDGCLHSEEPKVIISLRLRNNRGDKEDRSTTGAAIESNLATSMFFKRCNGTFNNMNREPLITKDEGSSDSSDHTTTYENEDSWVRRSLEEGCNCYLCGDGW